MLYDPKYPTSTLRQDDCFSSAVFTYLHLHVYVIKSSMVNKKLRHQSTLRYCLIIYHFLLETASLWPQCVAIFKGPKTRRFCFRQERSWSIAMAPFLQPNYGPPTDARHDKEIEHTITDE